VNGNSVFVAALSPELKRHMLLIDWLVDEANFAIVAVEGERSRYDSAARIFGHCISLIYNTRHLFTGWLL
jgi:hypothetical protein